MSAKQDKFPEHPPRNPSLALDLFILELQTRRKFIGMPKCAAKGTARATEASTSTGATIELERAMTLP